jgi:hypothetical protein
MGVVITATVVPVSCLCMKAVRSAAVVARLFQCGNCVALLSRVLRRATTDPSSLWSRVVLEKMIIAQLAKTFSTFLEPRRLVRVRKSQPLDPVVRQQNPYTARSLRISVNTGPG